MRWLFAFLLLANIGLWMWASWYRVLPDDAAGPRPPIAPEKLRLLKELPAGTAVPAGTEKRGRGGEAPAGHEVCYRLGPFTDAKLAAKAGERLDRLDFRYQRRAEVQKAITGYRVFLAPFPSKAAAERKRAELARLGFKDHALMHDGDGENGISLGVFSVEVNAQNRLRELAAKGVKADLLPIYHAKTVYWLEVAGAGRAGGDAASRPLAVLRAQDWRAREVKAEQLDCRALAGESH